MNDEQRAKAQEIRQRRRERLAQFEADKKKAEAAQADQEGSSPTQGSPPPQGPETKDPPAQCPFRWVTNLMQEVPSHNEAYILVALGLACLVEGDFRPYFFNLFLVMSLTFRSVGLRNTRGLSLLMNAGFTMYRVAQDLAILIGSLAVFTGVKCLVV